MYGATNTFIRQNNCKFFSDSNFNYTNLNQSFAFKHLGLDMYYINVDKDILNDLLFKNTEIIAINGIFQHIDSDAFKPFKYIKSIFLHLLNLPDLLYTSSDF